MPTVGGGASAATPKLTGDGFNRVMSSPDESTDDDGVGEADILADAVVVVVAASPEKVWPWSSEAAAAATHALV